MNRPSVFIAIALGLTLLVGLLGIYLAWGAGSKPKPTSSKTTAAPAATGPAAPPSQPGPRLKFQIQFDVTVADFPDGSQLDKFNSFVSAVIPTAHISKVDLIVPPETEPSATQQLVDRVTAWIAAGQVPRIDRTTQVKSDSTLPTDPQPGHVVIRLFAESP